MKQYNTEKLIKIFTHVALVWVFLITASFMFFIVPADMVKQLPTDSTLKSTSSTAKGSSPNRKIYNTEMILLHK